MVGRITLRMVGVTYIRPAREIMTRVISPFISGY